LYLFPFYAKYNEDAKYNEAKIQPCLVGKV